MASLPTENKPSRNNKDVIEKTDSSSDEDMETADTMVFQPLFTYRQRMERRQKIQNNKNYNNGVRPVSIPRRNEHRNVEWQHVM